jgi:hypothetical protein
MNKENNIKQAKLDIEQLEEAIEREYTNAEKERCKSIDKINRCKERIVYLKTIISKEERKMDEQ